MSARARHGRKNKCPLSAKSGHWRLICATKKDQQSQFGLFTHPIFQHRDDGRDIFKSPVVRISL